MYRLLLAQVIVMSQHFQSNYSLTEMIELMMLR